MEPRRDGDQESSPAKHSKWRGITQRLSQRRGGEDGPLPSGLPTYEDPPDLADSPDYLQARDTVKTAFEYAQLAHGGRGIGDIINLREAQDRNVHRGIVDQTADLVDVLTKQNGDVGSGDGINLLNGFARVLVDSGPRQYGKSPYWEEDQVRLVTKLLGKRIKSDPHRWALNAGGFSALMRLESDLALDILCSGNSQHVQKTVEAFDQNAGEQATKTLVLRVLKVGAQRDAVAKPALSSLVDSVFQGQSAASHLREYLQHGSQEAWNTAIEAFVDQEVETFDQTRAGEETYRHSMLYAADALSLLDVNPDIDLHVLPYLSRLAQSDKAPAVLTRQAARMHNEELPRRAEKIVPKGVPNPLGGFYA